MTSPALDATVIVPSHRGAHRLPTLLQALAAQDHEGPWEALIVLDGVLDDSRTVLDRFAERVPLRVLAFPEPRGVCSALNDGYAAAAGRVLIRCDDDLRPAPDMVRRHVAWHQGRDDLGVIGTTRDEFPDTIYARVYGRVANERLLRSAYARPVDQRWVSWAAHNSVTRESWDLAGGFDPSFVYGEDSELGYRLHLAGVHMEIDPALEIPHLGPATTAADRIPRAFVAGASRRRFAQTHPEAGRPPVSAAPASPAARAWGLGTRTLSAIVRTREGHRRVGAAVERVIPHVPERVARRMVAFAVEAAGASGAAYGPVDLNSLKNQKSRELARELGTRVGES